MIVRICSSLAPHQNGIDAVPFVMTTENSAVVDRTRQPFAERDTLRRA